MSAPEVLVVAGEPSGDRIAAAAASALASRGVRCFGLGGPACARAGVRLEADAVGTAAMGLGDVAVRAPAIAAAAARIAAAVRRSRPRAALLVSFTELNAVVGRVLRARGVPVLWCVAPQVWAWRAGRLRTLRGALDRLAVLFPFEEALWRGAGFDARYVGHPSVEAVGAARTSPTRAAAVLPGSRPGEVRRLASPLCEAAARLCAGGSIDRAALLLAPGLPASAEEVARAAAARFDVPVTETAPGAGAAPRLSSFDVALTASGTASLEAALAGAAPVVAYRIGRIAFALARRLVRVRDVALPNILLGRRAFPELLQEAAAAGPIAEAARALLDGPVASGEALAWTRELGAILAPPSPEPFGERVAALVSDWL